MYMLCSYIICSLVQQQELQGVGSHAVVVEIKRVPCASKACADSSVVTAWKERFFTTAAPCAPSTTVT